MADDTKINDRTNKVTEFAQSAKAHFDEVATRGWSAAKRATTTLTDAGTSAASKTKHALAHVDANHERIAEHMDTAAKVTRVAAGVAVIGAAIAAPTGIAAVGVAVGLVTAPVIVTAAPILIGIAGGAATASAAASLYKKARRKKDSAKEHDPTDATHKN